LEVKDPEEWIREHVFLCRDFSLASANHFFKDYQVIILDDLFKDRQNLDGMHGEIAVESFGEFIQDIYDQRKLVLVSSNFSLAHIQSRLEVVDTIGRTKSRFAELLAGGKRDFPLRGKDFREELARRHIESGADAFEL